MGSVILKILGSLFFIGCFLISCSNPNRSIVRYQRINEYQREAIFSIDWKSKVDTRNFYYTNTGIILKDTFSLKQLIYFRKNKVFISLVDSKSDAVVLFDFDSRVNECKTIKMGLLKSEVVFDCTLEKKINTKENLEVCVFRIEKWGNYFDLVLDAVVFVTKKHGVIGSYFTDNDTTQEKVMISPAGDILKEYIDYSKIQLRTLK